MAPHSDFQACGGGGLRPAALQSCSQAHQQPVDKTELSSLLTTWQCQSVGSVSVGGGKVGMIENDTFALRRLSEQEVAWDWVRCMTSRCTIGGNRKEVFEGFKES